jgi:DnaJ-class molecular chaperone
MNDFEFLGIAVGATKEQINSAYRSKALQYHPDRGGDPEVFKKIVEVYDRLMNTTVCGDCGGTGRKTMVLSPFIIDAVCGLCKGKGTI